MRKLLMLGAVAMALALPTISHAQFSIGARLGFAPAMGDAAKDEPLKDLVNSQVPLQLDAMYRVSPQLSAGLYFSYGFGQLNSDFADFCDYFEVDCSARSMRVGVQAHYAFGSQSQQFLPWAGAGLGMEWMTVKASAGGTSESIDVSGLEFLNLQAGADYRVSDQFSIGPYLQFSVGQYSKVDGESISEKAMHQWFGFGLRGKFDL
jgi:outer membrane protein W